MYNETTKSQTKPSVDWEAVRVLAIELGAREAARRLGMKESTVLSRARRDKWNLPKRKGGATLKSASAITLQSKPGDALIATHKELEAATKTGLSIAAAKAATKAAQNPPLDVSSTSQLRDLATSSSRIFGWDKKNSPHTQYNQLVVTAEQLEEMRQLRGSMTPEEREEVSKEVLEKTPEEWEELRRKARELFGGEQNMEHRTLPLPAPSGPVTYEVKIKGDGTGVEGDEGALS